jgi:hypothetical protein
VKPAVAASGRVLEPHVGHPADQIGDEPAHHGRGQRGPLFERAEEIEGQSVAGQQVGPETPATEPTMNHPSDPLPLVSAELLRRYSCAEPTDTRFRAIARLRQSLWREQQGYACGRYLDVNGRTRRLGSRVSHRVGRTGVNGQTD